MKPIAYLALRVPPRHILNVFIWPSLKAMRAVIGRKSGKSHLDTVAYFHGPRIRISSRGRVINKLVGEIHLVRDRYGAGIFAHELQHFIVWWCYVKKLDPFEKDWERVPHLTGALTTQFWDWYWKKKIYAR